MAAIISVPRFHEMPAFVGRYPGWSFVAIPAAPPIIRRSSSSDHRGAIMPDKKAMPDFPIQEVLAKRWSPYAFADKPVSPADLCSLFEAARWAPSSYNEQPWSYIVATKDQPTNLQRVLS